MDDHLEGPVQFVGETHGTISFDRYNQNEIDHKLPYDLIFIPDGMQQPAALDLVIWNEQHNHRVKAARKFVVWKKG
jgi:inosine/xanthosine triphosphate pyrophosphatase family protein